MKASVRMDGRRPVVVHDRGAVVSHRPGGVRPAGGDRAPVPGGVVDTAWTLLRVGRGQAALSVLVPPGGRAALCGLLVAARVPFVLARDPEPVAVLGGGEQW